MRGDHHHAHTAEASSHLRTAFAQVERYMPASPDRVDVIRRIGLAVARLERPNRERLCDRCGRPFPWRAPDRQFCRRCRRLDRQQAEREQTLTVPKPDPSASPKTIDFTGDTRGTTVTC